MNSQFKLQIPANSPFTLDNLPFGIFSTRSNPHPRPGVALGSYILDVQSLIANGYFDSLPSASHGATWSTVFAGPSLNHFAELGRAAHRAVRNHIQSLFTPESDGSTVLTPFPDQPNELSSLLSRQEDATMHLPMKIGDYTDFYAGRNHAFAVGTMFRGAANALQPNYEHLPVGYHGRASTVTVKDEVIRPYGQVKGDEGPEWTPTKKLDYELELGVFVGKGTEMGKRVPVEEAEEHLFGVVLLNDWSARDVQTWEYVPLGPFLSKSFSTQISPWVILMDALEPFRAQPLSRSTSVPLLPYLRSPRNDSVYDISLSVSIETKGSAAKVAQTSSKNLLFSFEQFVAHHTCNGCNLNSGDLFGSGTISGEDSKTQAGCLLEMTRNGENPRDNGRTWLEDGEVVIMNGTAETEVNGRRVRIGFGECKGVVKPAVP